MTTEQKLDHIIAKLAKFEQQLDKFQPMLDRMGGGMMGAIFGGGKRNV